MKPLFWIGLVTLILGIASLLVAIPRRERDGVNVGGVSIGIETKHDEKISPIVSAVIAKARGVPIAEVGTYRPRAPYKPITVGALAGMGTGDD